MKKAQEAIQKLLNPLGRQVTADQDLPKTCGEVVKKIDNVTAAATAKVLVIATAIANTPIDVTCSGSGKEALQKKRRQSRMCQAKLRLKSKKLMQP